MTDKLIQAFPEIMDVQFTAGMELKLDKIEEQHLDWIKLLQDFYGPFHAVVDGALGKIEHAGGRRQPVQVPEVRQADALPHQQERLLPRLLATASAAPPSRSISRASPRSARSASTSAPSAAAR